MKGKEETDKTIRELLRWRETLGTDFYIVLQVTKEKVSWLQMRPVDAEEDESEGDGGNSFFELAETDEEDSTPPLPAAGGVKKRKGEMIDYAG